MWVPSRVSVVLPAFNRARYLREAIESILAQTYRDFELIVVDDASTDATPEILSAFSDERVIIIRNEQNLGAARSRNVALARASGEFIALMDSDDRCAPERLEKQVAYLQAHPELAAVGTWARRIDAEGNRTGADFITPCAPEQVREAVMRGGVPLHPTALLRAGVLRAAGGYRPLLYVEDYDLWLRLTDEGATVAVIPEYLYEMRIHPQQETQTDWPTHVAGMYLVKEAALRRRAGKRDPLEGVSYSRFLRLLKQVQRGAGVWGRRYRAAQHWQRASAHWDSGQHRAALRDTLRVFISCPTYGPMWTRIGEAVRRRCHGGAGEMQG